MREFCACCGHSIYASDITKKDDWCKCPQPTIARIQRVEFNPKTDRFEFLSDVQKMDELSHHTLPQGY